MESILDFLQPKKPTYAPASLGNPQTLSGRIQEWLGAKEPDQGGKVQEILSSRFQPTGSDVGSAAVQTLFKREPISAQNVADNRITQSIEKLSAIKKLRDDEFNLDNMAQQAAYKHFNGIPLTQQEMAAVQAYSGFHPGGTYIDPATQSLVQKPSLFDALKINGQQPQGGGIPTEAYDNFGAADIDQQGVEALIGNSVDPLQDPMAAHLQARQAQAGKLQVTGPLAGSNRAKIAEMEADLALQKDKAIKSTELNQDQSRAATYSDRARQAEQDLTGLQNAQTSFYQRNASKAPLGNYAVSSNYQEASQAEQNFLTAVLRLESGATIKDEEIAMGRKQYFPQPGDGPDVIAQKKRNREIAIAGLGREAGPAYKPSAPTGSGAVKFLGFE